MDAGELGERSCLLHLVRSRFVLFDGKLENMAFSTFSPNDLAANPEHINLPLPNPLQNLMSVSITPRLIKFNYYFFCNHLNKNRHDSVYKTDFVPHVKNPEFV